MRSINLLFLFGMRRNCLRRGKIQSLYLSNRRALQQLCLLLSHLTFPTRYDMISNILLSWLPPHAEEVTVDHQYWFQYDKSTTDHILHLSYIWEKIGIPRTARCIKIISQDIKFIFYLSPKLVSKYFTLDKYLENYRCHMEILVCFHIEHLFVSFDFNQYLNVPRKFSRFS
jgi:hypothetical protein